MILLERLGHYRILGLLGRGAMGEVHLAEHDLLRVKRALKMLPEKLADSPEFKRRFVEEGRMLATLKHPHIVSIHDMISEGEIYAIVMDFVTSDGSRSQTLDDLLIENGGHLPAEEVNRLLIQICEAICYAHENGVIHRDIKPSNVLLDRNGSVRVSDFGLAAIAGAEFVHESIATSLSGSIGMQASRARSAPAPLDDSIGSDKTIGKDRGSSAAQSLIGTFHYMPPEVQEKGLWTKQGDIYSLGVLAYVMLTGQRPIGRWMSPSNMASGIPSTWDAIIEHMLEVNARDRYETVEDLLSDIITAPGISSTAIRSPARASAGAPRAAPAGRRAVSQLQQMMETAHKSGDQEGLSRAALALVNLDQEAFLDWACRHVTRTLDESGISRGQADADALADLLPASLAGLRKQVVKPVFERVETEMERRHADVAAAVAAGQLADADKVIASMRELAPSHARIAKADDLLVASRLREAEQELSRQFVKQLAKRDLDSARASVKKLALLKIGDNRLAELASKWQVRINETWVEMQSGAFDRLLAAGAVQGAVVTLNEMVRLLPSDPHTIKAQAAFAAWEVTCQHAEAAAQMELFEKEGKLEAACGAAALMLKLKPDDANAARQLERLRASCAHLETDRKTEAQIQSRHLARKRFRFRLSVAAATTIALAVSVSVLVNQYRLARLDDAARVAFADVERIDSDRSIPGKDKVAAWQHYLADHSATGYKVEEARKRLTESPARTDFEDAEWIEADLIVSGKTKIAAWKRYLGEHSAAGYKVDEAKTRVAKIEREQDARHSQEQAGQNLKDFEMEYLNTLRCEQGEGVPKDPVKAISLYQAQAAAGNRFAALRLGDLFENGTVTPRDPRKAIQFYNQAADSGSMRAVAKLAKMYLIGSGVSKDLSKAFELGRKAADAGDPLGMASLGNRYSSGEGVAKNITRACELYQKAADAGEPVGMCGLGFAYLHGKGVPKDTSKALDLFQKATNVGDSGGYIALGLMYETGTGVSKDTSKAIELYQKAADAGEPMGFFDLAGMYESGAGVPKDTSTAMNLFQKAAEAGEPRGFYELGRMNLGMGMPRNTSKTLELFQKAAEDGEPLGFVGLGTMYKHGDGVPKDVSKAMQLFQKAAEDGLAAASYNVGNNYEKGEDAQQSDTEAAKWYQKAIDGDEDRAMVSLGNFYRDGRGVPKSDSNAFELFRRAAEAGNPIGMCDLAFMYNNGLGCVKSGKDALKWYTKSAEAGCAFGMVYLGTTYWNGSDDVGKSPELAKQWLHRAADHPETHVVNASGFEVDDNATAAAEATKFLKQNGELGNP